MAKRKKKVTTKALPWNGDHGTGTQAALQGTTLEPVEGNNPNRFARRRRTSQSDVWKPKLSMRQWQAAVEIENAYCGCERLSSGGPLKERVDASPKPDAVVAIQVEAQSRLKRVMDGVPTAMRDVIEHLFWHNLPLSQLGKGRGYYNRSADVKVALDLVANKLRY